MATFTDLDSVKAWNKAITKVLRKYPNFFDPEFQQSEDEKIKLKFRTAKRMAVQIYEFELARRPRRLIIEEGLEMRRVAERTGLPRPLFEGYVPPIPQIPQVAWTEDIVNEGWLRMEEEAVTAAEREGVMLQYD